MQQPQPPTLTLPEDWQTALAIVAHPDDLEYGAASAISQVDGAGKENRLRDGVTGGSGD